MSPSSSHRRAFLQNGSLYLLGAGVAASQASRLLADDAPRAVRFGLVTDLHYADKPSAGSRHYRETLAKFAEAAAQFEKDSPDFIVELGDLIDAADAVEVEQRYLARIQKEFAALPGDKHYVLGNHCVDMLTKEEFLDGVGQPQSHYAFDAGGCHFVVLDACFRSDGKAYGRKNSRWDDANLPAEQLEWLQADLEAASGPVVVFAHQRLDVETAHGVKNAAQARKVLEASGKVLAVFQGHSHKNDLKQINGIHYCVQRAMVEGSGAENSGYAMVDLIADGAIRIHGYREQQTRGWKMAR
ncbi:metallophosphoesterase family protein [Lignipirellula cremea]|uniref:Calcineurin-like phosphoesterase superfamily domain protein n=1 Tax=Lignipirellula cremea TaxID=2528010 RepID=A0A518DN82_9BACT|nr:metallophosphoesterase [Lignipirellula cremea]QDU93294.1 Calcineurin-like phosphoesterase superfamily domain protein [Lignipirellula cremea]